MNALMPTRRAPLLHVASDRGTGPIAVLIHGVASSSVTFQNVLPLIEDSHRCITVDLPGFGQSPMPVGPDYALADQVAAVKRTIDSYRLRDPFTLVGHSIGALIAARYAAGTPRDVERLVLVSPPIYLTPEELSGSAGRRAHRYVLANRAFTHRYAECVERFLSPPRAMDLNESRWSPFFMSLEQSLKSQTTLSDIAAVRVPVEIILGSLDDFHSEGLMKVVSHMADVGVHRVVPSDHLIGKRLARVVATAIGQATSSPRRKAEEHV